MLVQHLPLFGQRDTSARAIEQLHSERSLELCYGIGDRRLRDKETFCRAGYTAAARRLTEYRI